MTHKATGVAVLCVLAFCTYAATASAVTRTNRMRVHMNKAKIRYHWIAEGHPARRGRILTYWTRTHRHTLHRFHNWQHAQRIAAAAAQATASSSPWTAAWYRGAMCVHSHEGAWDSNTGNGYYGGFQYLPSTWINSGGGQYASRADLATPHEQLLVTWHVTRSSGWGQWPNTARMCGLL